MHTRAAARRAAVAAHLALAVREHRLAALLRRAQVHEQRHDALPAALKLGVDVVVEVICRDDISNR
jgi:hypothetical protein